MPGICGENAGDVAWPLTPTVELPSEVPLPGVEQSGLEARFGPQTKNWTLPVTAPLAPERVAVSVTEPPSATEPELASVSKLGGVGATAEAFIERSWLPPEPSRSSTRMWYGEPLMAPALLPSPQLSCAPTWPPQAITTVSLVEVKEIVIDCWPAASLPPPRLTPVIEPFQIAK